MLTAHGLEKVSDVYKTLKINLQDVGCLMFDTESPAARPATHGHDPQAWSYSLTNTSKSTNLVD